MLLLFDLFSTTDWVILYQFFCQLINFMLNEGHYKMTLPRVPEGGKMALAERIHEA